LTKDPSVDSTNSVFERLCDPVDRTYSLDIAAASFQRSGYLYHKAGHECWLDPEGKPIGPKWRKSRSARGMSIPFKTVRKFSPFYPVPNGMDATPALASVNVCEYLRDVPEHEGLHMFMHMAPSQAYSIQLNNLAFALTVPYFRDRTMFLCYEKLSSTVETATKSLHKTSWGFLASNMISTVRV